MVEYTHKVNGICHSIISFQFVSNINILTSHFAGVNCVFDCKLEVLVKGQKHNLPLHLLFSMFSFTKLRFPLEILVTESCAARTRKR